MVRELSGLAWVPRFPTSKSTDSLVDGFRQKCEAFLAALADAGATVSISATLRPPERAYLMHWSFVVNSGEVEPVDVPPQAGVEFRPSLTSLHIFGKAIDMSIEWNGALAIKQKNGTRKRIRSLPRTGLNHDLWAVGATYGVLKLPSDAPHWLNTGH